MAVFPLCALSQDANSDLSEWNLVTSGNLDLINADVQGLAFVGGNVTTPNSFNVGTAGSGVISSSTVSLAVGGNIVGNYTLNVDGGSVVVGGTSGDTVNINSGGTFQQNDLGNFPPSPCNVITSASQYWSGLSANSSTSINAANDLVFNCASGASVAVFNVNASMMFGSMYQNFVLSPSSSTTAVLINISGSVANWAPGSSFVSEFNTSQWDPYVMFNFYNANTVNLSGQLGGYIVAPDASVTLGTSIQGGIMCSNLTAEGEIDLPAGGTGTSAWSGALPVPEPSTMALAVVGILGFVALSSFRRRP